MLEAFTNKSNIDWKELKKLNEGIEPTLASLNTQRIGNGRIIYKDGKFQPRSSFFTGYRLWQYILTMGQGEAATFDGTRKGFTDLKERCAKIEENLIQFSLENSKEQAKDAKSYLYDLIFLENLIDGVSKIGCEQLCKNYREAFGKSDESISLKHLSEDAFSSIKKSIKHLTNALSPQFPEIKNDIESIRSFKDCTPILLGRELNRESLRNVIWNREQGVVIPKELVTECSKIKPTKLTPSALRTAAAHFKIPQKAKAIPTLSKTSNWEPFRKPEKGVFGSCESDDLLSNAYFKQDSTTGQTMISCSAFSTQRKVGYLAEMIKKFERVKADGVWIIHQLNRKPLNQTQLSEELAKSAYKCSFLHLIFTTTEEKKIAKLVCEETKSLSSYPAIQKLNGEVGPAEFFLSEAKKKESGTSEIARVGVLNEIERIASQLSKAIDTLKATKQTDEVRKALVLYKLLQDILSNQISTTAKLERFLLLYRILKVKPIFVCENGLDQTSTVRSLADAQSKMEEEFRKEGSEIEALEKLHNLLQNIEPWKKELFDFTKQSIEELKFSTIKDLNESTDTAVNSQYRLSELMEEKKKDLREAVLGKIREKTNDQHFSELFETQVYLEMVFGSLLLDQEKTLNGTGAPGFKASLPFERWPLFILTDEKIPVQILEEIVPSWYWSWYGAPYLNPTQAADALVHRLGYLR